ncbi:Flagellin [compost metagenome]
MSLRIHTNVSAMHGLRQLRMGTVASSRALEQLSSGLRINRASDDAAGLAISERLSAQVRGLAQASRNTQDALSYMRVVDGALSTMHDMTQRMRELAVQAANGTYSAAERAQLNAEFQGLKAETLNVLQTTTYNGRPIIDGMITPVRFQVGANRFETLDAPVAPAAAIASYTAFSSAALTTLPTAQTAIRTLDGFIGTVSEIRGIYGAVANRLEHTLDRLAVTHENLAAANSRIRDADTAVAVMDLTRSQIRTRASVAMLAQANAQPGRVGRLLFGAS